MYETNGDYNQKHLVRNGANEHYSPSRYYIELSKNQNLEGFLEYNGSCSPPLIYRSRQLTNPGKLSCTFSNKRIHDSTVSHSIGCRPSLASVTALITESSVTNSFMCRSLSSSYCSSLKVPNHAPNVLICKISARKPVALTTSSGER